jgi:hypothetical protein
MAESTAGKNQGQCFARRHMKPGDYALYDYAAAVSRASGTFFSNDRRDAKEFGSGVSPRTIFGSRSRLEQAGWLKRIDKGPRQKFNPVTGQTLSICYRVLSHGEWAAAHPGKCRFTEQGQSKPETPAATIATGPAAESATGENPPAADFVEPDADFAKPAADSAAKRSKEREERKEEKGGPITHSLNRESLSSEARASDSAEPDQTQETLSLAKTKPKPQSKEKPSPKRGNRKPYSHARSHQFWLVAGGRGGSKYLKENFGVSSPARLNDEQFQIAMRFFTNVH